MHISSLISQDTCFPDIDIRALIQNQVFQLLN
jgi:hypothetical protein